MAKRERKLDEFEESLTPTQAAIRWMKEAHEHGSLREYALSLVGQPDTKAPLYRLHDLVIPGLEKRLKGVPPEEKSRIIRRALKDIAFLYYLQLGINTSLTLPPKMPSILSRVRSMGGDGHETEQVSRGTDHRHPQRAPGGVASRRALRQVRGQRRDVLQVAVQVGRHGGIRRQEAEGAGG